MSSNLKHPVVQNERIGEVFTPAHWASYAAKLYHLTDQWLSGKKIIDPCLGCGNLLWALIEEALKRGIPKNELPLHNLFGLELKEDNLACWLARLDQQEIPYNKANFRQGDICLTKAFVQADIIFTNPPWINFIDLPDSYKTLLKPYYHQYHLVNRAADMLLGNSRIDLSALIMAIAAKNWLSSDGQIVAFLPLSLFESWAHMSFREFDQSLNATLIDLYHLTETRAFNVASSYALAFFSRHNTTEEAKRFRWQEDQWVAEPLILDATKTIAQTLPIKKENTPRQGVNSCGANDIFFFNSCQPIEQNLLRLTNKDHEAILPVNYVYPLITARNFKATDEPQKWIFLPYDQMTGRPLSAEVIKNEPLVSHYLYQYEERLRARKGVIIKSTSQGDRFWSLLGIGSYSFAPYKVVWPAMGAKAFMPKIFTGNWQVNQAMQGSISTQTYEEALRIYNFLIQDEVKEYLYSIGNLGGKSFAQPSWIRKLFIIS